MGQIITGAKAGQGAYVAAILLRGGPDVSFSAQLEGRGTAAGQAHLTTGIVFPASARLALGLTEFSVVAPVSRVEGTIQGYLVATP